MGAIFITLPAGIMTVIAFICGIGHVLLENRRKRRRYELNRAISNLADKEGISWDEARKIIEKK